MPSDCFPRIDDLGITKMPKRVSFAPVCQTSTGEIDPLTTDQDATPTESPTVMIQKDIEEPRAQEIREESTVPPPGFRPFQWPQADWDDIGDATLEPGLKFVTSWSARITEERSSPPPLVPLSPITAEDSQDSIMVQLDSPKSEVYTPIGPDRIRSVHRRRPRRPLKMSTKWEKLAPADDFLFRDILCDPAMITTGLYRKRPEIETAAGCLNGAWPGRDHSRTNDHKPLFKSWGEAVLSDIRPTVWRTTLLRRAGLVSR